MNVRRDMTTYSFDGQDTPAYVARPDGEAPSPAVVAIQEWWGLVPHIKEVADRLAAEGFVVLAPDLYHGRAATEPDEARKLSMALDRRRAVAEIGAAARALRQRDDVWPKRVAAVGWCMGGGLALSAAAEPGTLDTAVCFYGRPLADMDVARLRVPVLGLYGAADHGIPLAEVRAFEAALAENGVPHEIHVYDGAGHAFFNDTRPAYDAEAAADAWARTVAWLRKHLGPPEPT